jgi:hypothetical protein
MSTESQTDSNRKNSQKSTGPRSAEGKARSSRNTAVHGLTGKFPILPGEDPAGLLDLAESYRAFLHPEGHVEEDLVERMAIATYRLRRIARIEVGYFDFHLRYNPMPEKYNQDGYADLLAWAFQVDSHGEGCALEKLHRYESRIQRDYSRCLKDLQTLQAARKKEIVQTNPKRKVTPLHPTPSGDSDTPEQPASDAPTPAPAPPDVEK